MKREQAILSIGMGPGQLEFIRRLKDLGFKVAGFGKGKNSPEAEALLDYKAELDTSDFESAKNWVDSLGVEITAVGSFAGGRAVATTQRLANYYKAPTAVPDPNVRRHGDSPDAEFRLGPCPRCGAEVWGIKKCPHISPPWRTFLACDNPDCAYHGKSRLTVDELRRVWPVGVEED